MSHSHFISRVLSRVSFWNECQGEGMLRCKWKWWNWTCFRVFEAETDQRHWERFRFSVRKWAKLCENNYVRCRWCRAQCCNLVERCGLPLQPLTFSMEKPRKQWKQWVEGTYQLHVGPVDTDEVMGPCTSDGAWYCCAGGHSTLRHFLSTQVP